ncbi:MAG: ATP12 family protein [Pseudomonadota bacterium]
MSDKTSPFDAIFTETGLDPNEAAQRTMRPDLPKRFWKDVTLDERDGAFHVLLDGRTAKSPGRNALASTHRQVAERIAAEWDAVGEHLDPAMLPLTKLVNVALDGGTEHREALLDEVRAYAGTDLLCYRAERPQGLVDRQNTVWDPYLDRLKTHHGISMKRAMGIMHVAQDDVVLDAIRALADQRALCGEAVAALALATSLTGSAILALALTEPGVDDGRAKTIWHAAHVDEDWNRAQWGEDYEATALRAARWRDFEAAAFVLSVTRR